MAKENKRSSVMSVRMPHEVKALLLDCAERCVVPKNYIIVQAVREYVELRNRQAC